VSHLTILLLAVGLAMDAFSVAVSAGPRSCPRLGPIRLAASFGAFQGLMPVLGALVGSLLYTYVRRYDHWVAFALLEAIGVKMIVEGLRGASPASRAPGGLQFDPSRGWPLLGLSLATSIDAFGAGIGMRMVDANLWVACSAIGLVTLGLAYLGARLGIRMQKSLGPRAELLGGIVLIALGFKMLQI
jgi:putative Mn2+ efflux pump MntP